MQLINQNFLIYKKIPHIISLLQLKRTIAFSKIKNYGSFYNLIVTIFPRNGVSITVLNFNLTIIE
ncbi:hypothetical protein B5P40_22240 [Bacillus sp. SRB_8]|nr:hypothetical protein B5P40_22240 [Bacillus sp. SRB_8]